jgi:acyl-coenzyme A thioesterase PaaI-like protein
VSEGTVAPGQGFPGINGPAVSTGDEPLNRLSGALRRIGAVTVGNPVPDDVVSDMADQLTLLADQLEAAAEPTKRYRAQPDEFGHPQDFFPTSPIAGYSNPIAPPADIWVVLGEGGQREIRGTVTFDFPYEGPPTCVHGGVIAELFDELLGAATIVAGQAAMTGTLTVRYRRPTPLLAPLDLVARLTGKEGRKVYSWGGIYFQGELTAEAEGIFIDVPPGRMLDIVTNNAGKTDANVIDPTFMRMIAENTPG